MREWIIVVTIGLFLVITSAISMSYRHSSFRERLFNVPTESELNYIATKTPPSALEHANRAFDVTITNTKELIKSWFR